MISEAILDLIKAAEHHTYCKIHFDNLSQNDKLYENNFHDAKIKLKIAENNLNEEICDMIDKKLKSYKLI